MNTFFIHVNNHANRKSLRNMTSKERRLTQPSYTVAGIMVNDTMRFGVAICNKEDIFSKDTGREMAINKASEADAIRIPAYIMEKKCFGKYFVDKAKRIIKKI